MKPYIYYNKLDSTKEPQGKFSAINLEDAIEIAAHIKQMPVEATANFVGMIHALTEIRDELQAQIEADINAFEISQGM
jgi:hypothetical protein